ncbi:hypothetical protein [Blastococcus sp. TF02A-30]|uniref:hypothetical protein n=1 Tax=Blastococcus sp. TF02A-30 TaxID=2250580 RepID=UPI000DE9A7A7|nr:hypothetical protein [Blastococcus sp. TF02A-30]RBY84517.1 hypothetical protein DQ241_17720 [Blastococcus sp. TF02A-30]
MDDQLVVAPAAPEPFRAFRSDRLDGRRAHRLRPFVVLLPLLLIAVFVAPAESPAAASSDVVVVHAGERDRLPVALDPV